MAEQTYYELLAVSKTATADEIKNSFKKLARQYHPDLHPNDEECATMFKKINKANEVLSDSEKRKEYDIEITPKPQMNGAGMGGMGAGMGMNYMGGNPMNGMRMNMGQQMQQPQQPQATSALAPIQVVVPVTFAESLRGVNKKVPVIKMDLCNACAGTGAKSGTQSVVCPMCRGQGKVQTFQQTPYGPQPVVRICDKCKGKGKIIVEPCPKCFGMGLQKVNTSVEVNLPRGMVTGQTFTVKGGGNVANAPGMPRGDLVLKVEVAPHRYMKRQENDLYLDLPVPLMTAILGGKVNVPTPDGMISYDIPEGVQSGATLKVRGKGVITPRGIGDLYLKVVIDIPKLDKKSKDLLLSMSQSINPADYRLVKSFESEMSEFLPK